MTTWKATSVTLPDGTAVELIRDAVVKVRGAQVLWKISAKEPRLPLLFEDSKGEPLFLYYEKVDTRQSAFHAVRVETGSPAWSHDFWDVSLQSYEPVAPCFVNHRVYYARSLWLDALDPDTGIVAERHYAGDRIVELEPRPDGSIGLELAIVGSRMWWPLTFRDGKIEDPLRSPSDYSQALSLMRFAIAAGRDFVGTGSSTEFTGYLDLHKFKTRKPSEAFRKKFAAYDLKAAEGRYREAIRQDPLNPYLQLYLAFCLKYQGRESEAQASYEGAAGKSLVSWREPLWMGGDCERLGLTKWADPLYETGIRAYFETVPAPPRAGIFFIDVLINFPAQRVSSALFYNGHVDRALHLLETRRRLFPYTQGEEPFSVYYARWLRASGKGAEAAEEEARIAAGGSSRAQWMPWWAQGWYGLFFAAWALAAVLLARILGAFRQIPSILYFVILLSTLPNLVPLIYYAGEPGDRYPLLAVLLAGILAAFTWLTARLKLWWIRRKGPRAEMAGKAATRRELLVLLSHSVVLYASALISSILLVSVLSERAWAGQCAGLVCLPLLWLFRRWGRRQPEASEVLPEPPPKDRRVLAFALTLLFAWLISAWYIYHIALVGRAWSAPVPSFDLGHPAWLLRVEDLKRDAISPSRDLLFAYALTAHLGGPPDRAKDLYEEPKLAKDPRALNNLGVLALPADPKGAEALFRKALKEDPSSAPALYNLGLLTGDASSIEKARKLDPWGVNARQRYCPGKPMIAQISLQDIDRASVWSWETVKYVTDPLSVFQVGSLVKGGK